MPAACDDEKATPIYDFKCLDCGETFEALVLKAGPPPCPACKGQKLEQLISSFRIDSEYSREQSSNDARRRHAKAHREYEAAQRDYEKHHKH